MIRFEKVPFEVYLEDRKKTLKSVGAEDEIKIREEWENIKLPARATNGSAGYDFYAPFMFSVWDGIDGVVVPTGIKFVTDRDDIFLMCVPRSGLGFKHNFRLFNTVGVIDSDYQFADNSGHIKAKMSANKTVIIREGGAYMQGIIVPFIKVDDDTEDIGERTGGFGSTDGQTE